MDLSAISLAVLNTYYWLITYTLTFVLGFTFCKAKYTYNFKNKYWNTALFVLSIIVSIVFSIKIKC